MTSSQSASASGAGSNAKSSGTQSGANSSAAAGSSTRNASGSSSASSAGSRNNIFDHSDAVIEIPTRKPAATNPSAARTAPPPAAAARRDPMQAGGKAWRPSHDKGTEPYDVTGQREEQQVARIPPPTKGFVKDVAITEDGSEGDDKLVEDDVAEGSGNACTRRPCWNRWGKDATALLVEVILALIVALIIYFAVEASGSRGLVAAGGWLLFVLLQRLYYWRICKVLLRAKSAYGVIIGQLFCALFTIPTGLGIALLQFEYTPKASPGAIFVMIFFGISIQLFTALLLVELAHFIWWVMHRCGQRYNKCCYVNPPSDSNAFRLGKLAFLFLFTVIFSAIGIAGGFAAPTAYHTDVTLAKLPPALDGYKIGFASDIHLGPTVDIQRIIWLVDTLNNEGVDVAAIVGDLTDNFLEPMKGALEPLRNLKPRDGVYFVTGNHEYYLPGDQIQQWQNELATYGVVSLRNERVAIPFNSTGPTFDLVGINDYSGDHDLPKAVSGRDQSRASVLLAHQPMHIYLAYDNNMDLMLSGHVHCGQLFPNHIITAIGNPYFNGLSTHKDRTQIYMSCGLGYWGPSHRFAAPSEISIITLRAPKS